MPCVVCVCCVVVHTYVRIYICMYTYVCTYICVYVCRYFADVPLCLLFLHDLYCLCSQLQLHDNKRIQTEILFLSRKFEESTSELSSGMLSSASLLVFAFPYPTVPSTAPCAHKLICSVVSCVFTERTASVKAISEKTALETYCRMLEKKCPPDVVCPVVYGFAIDLHRHGQPCTHPYTHTHTHTHTSAP
jgi:hypothetical protein